MKTTIEELEQYFGKDSFHLKFVDLFDEELIYVVTTLKNSKIVTEKRIVKVYNPIKSVARPSTKCDICIGGYSAKSKDIYGFYNKEIKSPSTYALKTYNSLTMLNYCKKEDYEEVVSMHNSIIKECVEKTKKELLEQIRLLNKIDF